MVNDAPGCVRDVFSDVASTSESNYVEPVVSWLEEKKKRKKKNFEKNGMKLSVGIPVIRDT